MNEDERNGRLDDGKGENGADGGPELTAFALGELEAQEHARVATLVAQRPELAREVEAIRALGVAVGAEERGFGDGLDDARRAAVLEAVRRADLSATAPAGAHVRRARLVRITAVAALLGVTSFGAFVLLDGARQGDHAGGEGFTYTIFGGGEASGPSSASGARQLETKAQRWSYADKNGQGGGGLRALGYSGNVSGGTGVVPVSSSEVRRSQFDQEVQGAGSPGNEPLQTEEYDLIEENPFRSVEVDPLSTFAVDVDTASYANVRRFLSDGSLPPPSAVRIEELVNYFDYGYAEPDGARPFATHVDVAACPWAPEHRLVRIGLQARRVNGLGTRGKNLVFLLDVSGSMNQPDKLPLLVRSMRLLVDQLGPDDTIAIVTYAGRSGVVLPPVSGSEKPRVLEALAGLQANGSTNGAAGIELAYDLARQHFLPGGVNRVVLATDGDFNVGVSSEGELVRLIEAERASGVGLSVLGFGRGNLADARMEQLADHGDGNYAYIDSLHEARKVLVAELGGTLETIAKDVKLQVEFNPAEVRAYRLIGYENRLLAHEDFNDDTKDAGEIGVGHDVTALYELVPRGVSMDLPGIDPLKYQANEPGTSAAAGSGEYMTVKLRYKEPTGARSQLIEVPVRVATTSFDEAPESLRFATAVAAFGLVLRASPNVGTTTLGDVYEWAFGAAGDDPFGYRAELLHLVQRAQELAR